jgi:chemotaxis protein methyltransferase CheR
MIETISDSEFRQLAHFIQDHYGIHLKQEKKTLVMGRLNQVLLQMGFSNFTEYINYLKNNPSGEVAATLENKITTNHTFFMREPEHFYFLRDVVLPFVKLTVKSRDLRIWCAACSTGEEPYTLAMIIDEYFGADKSGWDTKILATDLSGQALATAQEGVYSDHRLDPLPLTWRNHYFQKHGTDDSVVIDRIRREVIFRKLNLMTTQFPFKKKMHAIFCRNVMIYFDNPAKEELIQRFYDILEPGGYLFIGHTESIPRGTSRFIYVMPAVYRKE